MLNQKNFSLLSEFSGRVYQERTTRVTNDLKSDPNLGQFISPENPNVPIYGALFPLSDENQTRALLWIREGGSSLESIRDHLQTFEMLTEQLYQRLFQKPDLTQNAVLEALSFHNLTTTPATLCLVQKFKDDISISVQFT